MCFPFLGFSQYSLSGTLTDTEKMPVVGAVVLLKDTESAQIISFTTSDGSGHYLLNFKNSTIYEIEVNHIAYQTHKKSFQTEKNTLKYTIDFQMTEKQNVLEEVTVLGESLSMKHKGDTLSYNLKAFTTGGEKNLKDILERLPGIDIDQASGKIKANGKVIDNLLVDGNKFFGDNHKLATENLPAEMISGVDLLKNYTDNQLTKEIEKGNQTALNIKVDEKYKGRPVGNVTAFGGYEKRYKVAASMFNFNKKANLSFVGNTNNTNEEIMSVLDYLNLIKSVKQYAKSSNALSDYSIPKMPQYLMAKNNLSGNTTRFGALNFSYFPDEKLKIEGFSILNYNELLSNSTGNKRYRTAHSLFNHFEHKKAINKGILNQTTINIEYSLSPQSVLHYSLISNPTNNDDLLNVRLGENDFESVINDKNNHFQSSLGQQLTYINRLSSKSIVTATAFHEWGTKRSDKKINSSRNLFNMGNNFVQQQNQKYLESGFYAKYSVKPKRIVYSFSSEFQHLSENFDAKLNSFSPANISVKSLSRKRNVASVASEIAKKTGVFQFSMLNKGAYIPDFGKQWYYLPRASVKLEPKNTQNISLSYKRDFSNLDLIESSDIALLSDYQNIYYKKINPHQIFVRHNFDLQLLYIHAFSGTHIFGYLTCGITENPSVSNSEIFDGYSKTSYHLSNSDDRNWTANLSIERKIKPLRIRWKVASKLHTHSREEFLSGAPDVMKSRLYSPSISISSYFKNPNFNFSAGLNTNFYKAEYQNNNYNFKTKEFTPFFNIESIIGGFSCKVQNSYTISKNPYQKRDFYQLDFLASYQTKKGEFFIQANDLLNIDSTEIIQSSVSHFVESNQILSRIPGYIGLGFKFKF